MSRERSYIVSKNVELLGSMPVSKALAAMGIPAMIGMMVNALYNLVDGYFVGGLGTSQMGAVSVVFPLGQVIVGLGLLFGNGAASYISRLLGSGDQTTASTVASTALFSSAALGAMVIIGTILFLHPLLKVLGATESILPYAADYAIIYVPASIFNICNVTMNNIVTSEGGAKTTMYALLSGAVLNMALDPVFIYGFDLGVAGAAVATAISQMVSAAVYVTYVLGKKTIFHFSIKACCFSKKILLEILKIGIPTLVFQLLTSLAIALINMRASDYGDSLIAGMGAVTRVLSLGSLMVFGFLKGFQPIAGYSYAAKRYGRLREAIKTSIVWSTIFCAVFGLAVTLFSAEIITMFTKGDTVMIQAGQHALAAGGASFLFFGFYTVYSFLYLALGRAKEGFFLGALRQGICFVPIVLLFPAVWNMNGVLYAQPVADVMTAAITVFMAVHLSKELAAAER